MARPNWSDQIGLTKKRKKIAYCYVKGRRNSNNTDVDLVNKIINDVKKNKLKALKKYENRYVIIKIPVVSEVLYGRKVGYKFRKVKLSKKIQKISASNIRKKLLYK